MSTFASSRETTEGTIYSVTGGDWDQVASEIGSAKGRARCGQHGSTTSINPRRIAFDART